MKSASGSPKPNAIRRKAKGEEKVKEIRATVASLRLDTIAAIAASGVTYVSVGRLTQSAPAADIGLDFTAL